MPPSRFGKNKSRKPASQRDRKPGAAGGKRREHGERGDHPAKSIKKVTAVGRSTATPKTFAKAPAPTGATTFGVAIEICKS
jgi:hypothetical protein